MKKLSLFMLIFTLILLYWHSVAMADTWTGNRANAGIMVEDAFGNAANHTAKNGGTSTVTLGTTASESHRWIFRDIAVRDSIPSSATATVNACTLWIVLNTQLLLENDSMEFDLAEVTNTYRWIEAFVSHDSAATDFAWGLSGMNFDIIEDKYIKIVNLGNDSLRWTVNGVADSFLITSVDSIPIPIPLSSAQSYIDSKSSHQGWIIIADAGAPASKIFKINSVENATEARRPFFDWDYITGVERGISTPLIRSLYVADTQSTTSTLKLSDTLILNSIGSYLIFSTFSGEMRSAANDWEGFLFRESNNDTIGRIVSEYPQSITGDFLTYSIMGLIRKHDTKDDSLFIKYRNRESTAYAGIRARSILTANLDDYGEELKDWRFTDKGDTTLSSGSWISYGSDGFIPTADETWLLIHHAIVKSASAASIIESRFLVINEDGDDTSFINITEFTTEAATDQRSQQGGIALLTLEADSNYTFVAQFKGAANLTPQYSRICLLRTGAFATMNADSAISYSNGNNSTPRVTLSTQPDLNEQDGHLSNIISFFSQASTGDFSTDINPQTMAEQKQDDVAVDTSYHRDLQEINATENKLQFFGTYFFDNSTLDSQVTTELWGKVIAFGKYGENRVVHLSTTPDTSRIHNTYLRTQSSENHILDAHIFQGAVSTNYGQADSLQLGRTGNNQWHVLILDSLNYGGVSEFTNRGIIQPTKDEIVSGLLYLKVKNGLASLDTVIIDFYVDSNSAGSWGEAHVTWDSARADPGTKTDWSVDGGEGLLIDDDYLRLVGLGNNMIEISFAGVVKDTLYMNDDNPHIPIPITTSILTAMCDNKATGGPDNKGLLMKTDSAKTSANARISFHSSEATNVADRPYWTYEYLELGDEADIGPPQAGDDLYTFIIGDGVDDSVPGAAWGWADNVANRKHLIDDAMLYQFDTDRSYTRSTTLNIGKNPSGPWYSNMPLKLNQVDSIIPPGWTCDSAKYGWAVAIYNGNTPTVAITMKVRLAELTRVFSEESAGNGNNRPPSYLWANKSPYRPQISDTAYWTWEGGFNQTDDHKSPMFTSDCCQSGGAFDGKDGANVVGYSDGFDGTLIPEGSTTSRMWLKVDPLYINQLDSHYAGIGNAPYFLDTFTANIPVATTHNDSFPVRGLLAYIDTTVAAGGDDLDWIVNLKSSEFKSISPLMVYFLRKTAVAGKATMIRIDIGKREEEDKIITATIDSVYNYHIRFIR